jgi:ketosteroid isomerase-like protein
MLTVSGEDDDPVTVFSRVLDRISALDKDGVAALFDENIRFEHMFMPDGVPVVRTSRRELVVDLVEALGRFDNWHIWMTNAYRIVNDPATVICESESEGRLKSGDEYRNSYIGIHKVRDGRIVYWRQYAHPNPLQLVWTATDRPRT